MKSSTHNLFATPPRGFALLITLVVLVVLASLMTGLSIQLTMAKRRQEYMIEYQRSRYGLDSAIKYILADLPDKKFNLETRQGQPDFSDLFTLDSEDYAAYIAYWAENATDEQIQAAMKDGASMKEVESLSIAELASNIASLFGAGDPNSTTTSAGSPDDVNEPGDISENEDLSLFELDPNDIEVPGPYGAAWPYVIEPIELEMGPCEITITIEDENAKMPLSWLVTNLKDTNEQAQASLETFCEWMGMEKTDIENIQSQMDEICKKKVFTVNSSPIILKTTTTSSRSSSFKSTRTTSRRRSPSRTRSSASTTKTVTKTRPASAHRTDFAKLFHSSMLDHEALNQPRLQAGERTETAAKYLGLWGSQRINVNTAPRHVLEAAFILATSWDDACTIAEAVIQKRQIEPIKDTKEIQEIGFLDTDTFNNLKNYISTQSTFFMIHITSRSNNATSRAVVTVIKEGKNVEKLAILYDK